MKQKKYNSEEIKNLLVYEAEKDVFMNVGRVLLDKFTRKYEVTIVEVVRAKDLIPYETRMRSYPNIMQIYFSKVVKKNGDNIQANSR